MSDGDHYPALGAVDLTKTYGAFVALDRLTLEIECGELVALVGANGAGKSTFMRLAAGLLDPTGGEVFVHDAEAGSIDARAELSYIGDQPALYDDLSLNEHIDYITRLHGIQRPAAATALLDTFGLTERSDDLPAHFSRGMRQKAALILGLVRPFSVLLIDEPFVGLDPAGQLALTTVLGDIAEGGAAVVVATHQMTFLEHTQRCVALQEGRIAYDGPVDLETIDRYLQ